MRIRRGLKVITVSVLAIVALPAGVGHADTPPHGRVTAAIRTADGHYLTIVNGGGLGYVKSAKALCALYTDAKGPGPRAKVSLSTALASTAFQRSVNMLAPPKGG